MLWDLMWDQTHFQIRNKDSKLTNGKLIGGILFIWFVLSFGSFYGETVWAPVLNSFLAKIKIISLRIVSLRRYSEAEDIRRPNKPLAFLWNKHLKSRSFIFVEELRLRNVLEVLFISLNSIFPQYSPTAPYYFNPIYIRSFSWFHWLTDSNSDFVPNVFS